MKRLILLSLFCLIFTVPVLADDIQVMIQKGDSLFQIFDNPGALEAYLQVVAVDSNHYEANWKTARAYVDIGETIEDDDERAAYYQKGNLHARKATEVNPEGSMGHLFLSIALGRVALDAGAKERIRLSKEIKKETDLAIKYDPNNATAYHVLGRWNRKLANLSWIEKGFANMFLGGVPEDASDENAVAAFKKAIELEPHFINHYLELGITFEMMDMDEEALLQYQKCLDLPKSDSADDKHKEEAKSRIEDL